MSYQNIKQQDPNMAELNEPVDLEGSETDIEANPPESEDSYFLGWKRRNLADNPAQNLLKKALKANVPFIVSLHLLVFNLTLSIALGSLVWKSWGSANSGSPPSKDFAAGELLYTIGQDIVEERVERAYIGPGYSTGWIPSPYQGWPSDESDRLWKKYEDGNHIRITKEEADRLPHPTVHVPLEEYRDDYMVGLHVFHHLHCLSAVRRAIYPKRYNSALYDEDGKVDFESWHHIDHCIEFLRTYLECHPDMTAMPFHWMPESMVIIYPDTLHTCRNFDVISDWVYDRSVNVPVRSHWENGRVVDYTGKPFSREYNATWLNEPPDGWAYTKDDM